MSKKVEEWTVLSMLEWATDFFENKDIPDPRHSIEWLLAETLEIKRLDLYLKFDRPLSPQELDTLRPMVKRRAQHEPLQYIVGYTDFINAHISVNEQVLIPRIETEQLVEIILDEHQSEEDLSVLDIGTGSGCIPIALKMEQTSWEVSGIDISEGAIHTARNNAEQNDADVSFTKGDILNPNSIIENGPFNIIVSNPPYVKPGEKDILQQQVKDYEPAEALFFGDLEKMYNSIIEFASQKLTENGYLYLELHEKYSQEILAIFDEQNWSARIENDYDKKPRFIIAQQR
ncbi:protein-(glutamine-N5) methyltransferase, release factor-specific [Aliifodinibius salipaludis]|uniref:Protein-(Glutamine-N5) methyltransferase, release factor-specific n=1 Tax=Fodinibius salipaludis TaxID=2032627 RepID=A0A2A2G915_9BACT|nr:peptide chain release factor N(5)-glutamine methyltransferase [Aliifodinibius salipaludis]PAU94091.1 protein-(glutamine-N5) methyltransferase, release factor-specific [Aliifodinibius salipaludis]